MILKKKTFFWWKTIVFNIKSFEEKKTLNMTLPVQKGFGPLFPRVSLSQNARHFFFLNVFFCRCFILRKLFYEEYAFSGSEEVKSYEKESSSTWTRIGFIIHSESTWTMVVFFLLFVKTNEIWTSEKLCITLLKLKN